MEKVPKGINNAENNFVQNTRKIAAHTRALIQARYLVEKRKYRMTRIQNGSQHSPIVYLLMGRTGQFNLFAILFYSDLLCGDFFHFEHRVIFILSGFFLTIRF